ncbi:MAG: hypothetical protein WD991_01715 [Candidatus Paceibacterota bacterium]
MQNNKTNFEDYSSGRVIYGAPGATNFSVRLVSSMFERCKEYLEKVGNAGPYTLYDSFCGSGYSLSVLGFLYNKDIKNIFASDFDKHILEFADKNLALLSHKGISKRVSELDKFVKEYGKDSHKEAIKSAETISSQIKHEIDVKIFHFDVLNKKLLPKHIKNIDMVIVDIPYGKLTRWQGESADPSQEFLNKIKPYMGKQSIVAISANKKQTVSFKGYNKIGSLKVPKRKVLFLVPN